MYACRLNISPRLREVVGRTHVMPEMPRERADGITSRLAARGDTIEEAFALREALKAAIREALGYAFLYASCGQSVRVRLKPHPSTIIGTRTHMVPYNSYG